MKDCQSGEINTLSYQSSSSEMIVRQLQGAARQNWSGTLHFSARGELLGHLVLSEGKVCWAISRYQAETLGEFLWHLGYITKTQLDLAHSLFRAHQGQRQLGTILEDCGFCTRSVLRRAILLHTRSAIASLMGRGRYDVAKSPREAGRGEEFLFDMEELLPLTAPEVESESRANEKTLGQYWSKQGPDNAILSPFVKLPHYCASAIYNHEGGLLCAQVKEGCKDPMEVGVVVASVLEKLDHGVAAGSDLIVLSQAKGWLMMRPIDDDHRFIVAVATHSDGDPRRVRRAIEKRLSAIQEWIAGYDSPRRFKMLLRSLLLESSSREEVERTMAMATRERLRLARWKGEGEHRVEALSIALDKLEEGQLEDALAILGGVEDSVEERAGDELTPPSPDDNDSEPAPAEAMEEFEPRTTLVGLAPIPTPAPR
jgi:hypothetical protein